MTHPQYEGHGGPAYGQQPPAGYASSGAAVGRPGVAATALKFAPLGVVVLGIAGFFFGFGRFATYGSRLASGSVNQTFFESGQPTAVVLLLIAGLTAAVGYVTRRQWGIGASAAVATAAALLQLCGITAFSDRVSAGWAYWVVLVLALVQAALAVAAVLAEAGLMGIGKPAAGAVSANYGQQAYPYGQPPQPPYGAPYAGYGQPAYAYGQQARAPQGQPRPPYPQQLPPQYGPPPQYGQGAQPGPQPYPAQQHQQAPPQASGYGQPPQYGQYAGRPPYYGQQAPQAQHPGQQPPQYGGPQQPQQQPPQQGQSDSGGGEPEDQTRAFRPDAGSGRSEDESDDPRA